MRVLVCGGREFNDTSYIHRMLDSFHKAHPITLLIEGGARGADLHARLWAKRRGITFQTFEADWNTYAGHYAGRIRNHRMLREGAPSLVIGFPGGKGTRHMLTIAATAGVRTINLAHHYGLVCLGHSIS